MPSMMTINEAYNSYRDRYYHLLSRGARREFYNDLDYVFMKIKSVERAWPELINSPERLHDVVVSVGLQVKPILDKIESKYPAGTTVEPGSTGEQGTMEPSSLPTETSDELLDDAPEGISVRGPELFVQPWYYLQGIDLRWVGSAVLGLAAVTILFKKVR